MWTILESCLSQLSICTHGSNVQQQRVTAHVHPLHPHAHPLLSLSHALSLSFGLAHTHARTHFFLRFTHQSDFHPLIDVINSTNAHYDFVISSHLSKQAKKIGWFFSREAIEEKTKLEVNFRFSRDKNN